MFLVNSAVGPDKRRDRIDSRSWSLDVTCNIEHMAFCSITKAVKQVIFLPTTLTLNAILALFLSNVITVYAIVVHEEMNLKVRYICLNWNSNKIHVYNINYA